MKSYRIFLPLKYNNYRKIKRKKLHDIVEKIRLRFGAYSLNTKGKLPFIEGAWTDETSEIYKDDIWIVELIVDDTVSNQYWINSFKVKLEKELDQKVIFIIVQNAEIVI